MPPFGSTERIRNLTRVPVYKREIEGFRAEILFNTLREKGYALSLELASIHAHQNSLEGAAEHLRKVLPPPREHLRRHKNMRWFWALAITGFLLISVLGGVVLYVIAPEIFEPMFLDVRTSPIVYWT